MSETAGHNLVDQARLADLRAQADALLEQAARWIESGASDEAEAGHVNDTAAALKTLHNDIEGARKADKKPHTDAATAVDTQWKRLGDPVGVAASRLRKILTDFAKAQKARERAEVEAERRRLEEERGAAAAKASTHRARGDIGGEVAAAQEADALERERARLDKATPRGRIESATGAARPGALRERRVATAVTSPGLAMRALRQAGHAELIDQAMLQIANRVLRAKDGPDSLEGFTVETEEMFV